MDDRTSTPLNSFSNIQDLLQFRANRQSEELAYCSVDNKGREGRNKKRREEKKKDLGIQKSVEVEFRPNPVQSDQETIAYDVKATARSLG